MNIIITETFKKDFLKIFKSELFLENFSQNLKNIKSIKLTSPYNKFKLQMWWIHLRWIYIILLQNKYLPIFVVKKSNKKYWNNLLINNKNIYFYKLKYEKSINDIENNNFKIY